jgi:hypothetical protein
VHELGPHVAGSALFAHAVPHLCVDEPLQVNPHVPASHTAVPFSSLVHTFVQLLQWFGSVFVLTHVLPH